MEKCWANSFGKCGNKLTGEHLISKSILPNKKIKVQGFSWCKDEPKEIGIASLVSNFLCDQHNRALSPYDKEISNFVSSVESFVREEKKFSKYGFSLKKIPVIFNINGVHLEKWFVKTLINVCLVNHKEAIINYDKILPVLFSSQSFEKPYGLNFAVSVGQMVNIIDEIQIAPLFNDSGGIRELGGGLFTFRGFRIILLLPCSKFPIEEGRLILPNNLTDFLNLQLNWHNEEINMNMTRNRKSIKVLSMNFKW